MCVCVCFFFIQRHLFWKLNCRVIINYDTQYADEYVRRCQSLGRNAVDSGEQLHILSFVAPEQEKTFAQIEMLCQKEFKELPNTVAQCLI